MTEKQLAKRIAVHAKTKAAKEFATTEFGRCKPSNTLHGRYLDALYALAIDDSNGKALLTFKNGFDKYDLVHMLDKIREEFEAENGKEKE